MSSATDTALSHSSTGLKHLETMAGFTQRLYETVCVKVPDGVFLCETADLHSGRNFMQQKIHASSGFEYMV